MAKPRNVVVALSGGPTPVINNSLRGVIETCHEMREHYGTVYAAACRGHDMGGGSHYAVDRRPRHDGRR